QDEVDALQPAGQPEQDRGRQPILALARQRRPPRRGGGRGRGAGGRGGGDHVGTGVVSTISRMTAAAVSSRLLWRKPRVRMRCVSTAGASRFTSSGMA